jgi:hypothetical protein
LLLARSSQRHTPIEIYNASSTQGYSCRLVGWQGLRCQASWNRSWLKTSHGNAGVWKAWKAIKPAFHPSHTPWKSLRGLPHYHGYGDDYHVSEDRQSPPKTRNQSHSHRKGLVNHVSGLKRKGCPGTLTPLSSFCCCRCSCFSGNQGSALRAGTGPPRWGRKTVPRLKPGEEASSLKAICLD